MSDSVLASVISIVPSVVALGLAIYVLVAYHDVIRRAADGLAWRVKSGARVTVASIELGELYIAPGGRQSTLSKVIEVKKDEGQRRYQERGRYYLPNRDIFLVHTVRPSNHPDQLYDISLYLIPHKSATLGGVQRVEYYFGKHWGDRIFVATDRSTRFLVTTSAYGPFVCTAEVHFTDGGVAMLSRYVDFEMGFLGKG